MPQSPPPTAAPSAGAAAAGLPAAVSAVAEDCAQAIVDAFIGYNADFRAVTRRAPQRFEARDWVGSQRDAVERIELYDRRVKQIIAELSESYGEAVRDRSLWTGAKRRFAELIESMPDNEFMKTFFSSTSRSLFGTVGLDPEIEFVALDVDPLRGIGSAVLTNTYVNRGSLELLFEELLADFRFKTPYKNFDKTVQLTAAAVASQCAAHEHRQVERVEIIRPVFYQITRAYLVGRVIGPGWMLPLVIALKNTDAGVVIDAVMTSEDRVSVLFSFTRSYYHVDLERVGEAVVFLHSILPRKRISELFTVLGRARQGKTERYRELFRHLGQSADEFVLAAGERGLVMVVFTLPSFDVVFKLIRDRFAYPKNILREEVIAKYELVFKHDRAGRLVDAQEFKRLRFPLRRFSKELLQELLSETAGTAHVDGEDLIIDHCYIERRMTPLNLFLHTAPREEAVAAALDYGQAIRDLAYTNIFAGDLLLKNFGVTRHGRVIFYDYDELCAVTDCKFRDIPAATNDEDELRAESWFYVGETDVFPETFINFLGFDDELKELFLKFHGEILTAQFWRGVQQRLAQGEVLEVLPYQPARVNALSSA
jgi:isocitrate dehydrogenase kinase/phosphatase